MKRYDIVKGQKGQHLNQHEADLINGKAVEGVLLFNATTKNKIITLTYNTSGLISMCDFLRMNEMGKRLFVVLMRNILVALNSMEQHGFDNNSIVWGLHTSYVDPASWRVYLMYVPLQSYETKKNLKTYLQEIVAACNFIPGKDTGYVRDLTVEMDAVVEYTRYMFEFYCAKVSEELSLENAKKRESIPQTPQNIAQKSVPHASARPVLNMDDTVRINIGNGANTRGGELSVNEDEHGVVTVFRGANTVAKTAWFELRGQVGRVQVVKVPFRIGKLKEGTDFCIRNNNVSRKHADIFKEQGEYFIMDLGSTNGTYVNGKRLQSGVKELLHDGSVIKLADTELRFYMG